MAVITVIICSTSLRFESGYGLDAQDRAVVFVGQQVEQSVWTLPYLADPLPQFAEQRFATQFFGVGVEDDTFEVAGPRDLAGAHRADEDVALPAWKAIAGVNGQARSCDRRNPRDERRLQAFSSGMFGNARTSIVAPVAHERPTVVAARQDDVDLVAAVRTVLAVPYHARLRMDDERQSVAMAERVDLRTVA